MNYFSDALTIGLVLVLLFGSIALYLYTRIQQTEQKSSLLESILLDLKMNAEMKSYSELPADQEEPFVASSVSSTSHVKEEYTPFEDPLSTIQEHQEEQHEVAIDVTEEVVDYKSAIQDAVKEVSDVADTTIVFEKMEEESGYELMTLKELQSLAKSRGISGSSGMKKNALIDALKVSDRSDMVKPGPLSSSSMVDQSESLSHE